MTLSRFARLALISALMLPGAQAIAISEDDKSMTTPSGGARFSDPDEQTPTAINLQGSSSPGAGNVDPSTIRYDYDATSGSYVPHKN